MSKSIANSHSKKGLGLTAKNPPYVSGTFGIYPKYFFNPELPKRGVLHPGPFVRAFLSKSVANSHSKKGLGLTAITPTCLVLYVKSPKVLCGKMRRN